MHRIPHRLLLSFLLSLATWLSVTAHAATPEDFRHAAVNNDARAITKLAARGVNANTAFENGNRALHLAALENTQDAMAALIKTPGIELDAQNAAGETALMLAIIRGHTRIAQALLAAGAQLNKPGWAPLHYAASTGNNAVVKLLLDKYALIDAQSPNGTTPLMMAARHGHASTVKLLADEGADLFMANEQGMTARGFATRHEHNGIAQTLGELEEAKRRELASKPRAPAVDLNLPENKALREQLLGPSPASVKP
jgi:uncharacterized protein